MYEHVVVGVDFSPGGEAVLRSLSGLRSLGTRRLTLVHAIGITYPTPEASFPPDAAVDLIDEFRDRLRAEVQELATAGFEVGFETPIGDAAESIASAAEDTGAGLILVGSRSHSRVSDAFVGSVAWGVVHRAKVPVLVQRIVPAGEGEAAGMTASATNGFELVVHPTDWSPMAEAAFGHVAALARTGAIPTFLLLHVRSELEEARTGKSTEIEDRRRLEELADRLRSIGAKQVRIEAPSGAPFVEIVERSGAPGTLTVMGTRGRGLVGDAILGSVGRETLRKSRGAVLLVRR